MEIKAKKWLGQNFLNNNEIINKIVDSVDVSEYKNIIEIGPGCGALTKPLLEKCEKLIAYEVDNDLINYLTSFKFKNLKIINKSFLDADLSKYNDTIIFGNIPYNITSEIIFKLVENSNNIKYAILMVQEEVANRIVADVNSKTYGKLTVSVQYVAEAKKIIDVAKENFDPMPKVNSSVILLEFNKKLEYDLTSFLKFIKNVFQFKRKTLWNNLVNKYSIEKVKEVFEILKFDKNIRSEQISINLFKKIYETINFD